MHEVFLFLYVFCLFYDLFTLTTGKYYNIFFIYTIVLAHILYEVIQLQLSCFCARGAHFKHTQPQLLQAY